MGKLSVEIEKRVDELFEKENGTSVSISDQNEADRVSSLVSEYCDGCGQCLASAPVISLSEVERSLRGSGLFAVGLSGIKDKEECPLAKEFGAS